MTNVTSSAHRRPQFNWQPLQLAGLQVQLLDDPVERPVRTSFGTMRSRPGLLLRVVDAAGVAGYGEVWCNFPAAGARYRACLALDVVAPLMTGLALDSPDRLLPWLESRLAVLALQCGDFGAIAQVLA